MLTPVLPTAGSVGFEPTRFDQIVDCSPTRATSRFTSPPPTGPILATYLLGSFQDRLSIVVTRVGFEPTRSFEQ